MRLCDCTWGGAHSQVRTVADITSSSAGLRSQFKAAVSAKPQGKTNVHLGLDLAVSKLLEKDKSAIKRILLFTDGMPSNMTAAEKSFLAAKAAGVIVQARLLFVHRCLFAISGSVACCVLRCLVVLRVACCLCTLLR